MLFLKVYSPLLYCTAGVSFVIPCYHYWKELFGSVGEFIISSPVATIGQERNSPVRESSLSLLLILYSVVYLQKRGGGSLVV